MASRRTSDPPGPPQVGEFVEEMVRFSKGEVVDVSLPLRDDVNLRLWSAQEQEKPGSFSVRRERAAGWVSSMKQSGNVDVGAAYLRRIGRDSVTNVSSTGSPGLLGQFYYKSWHTARPRGASK